MLTSMRLLLRTTFKKCGPAKTYRRFQWPRGLRRGLLDGIVGSNPAGGHGYLFVVSVVR